MVKGKKGKDYKVKEPKTSWVVPGIFSQCSVLQKQQRPSWNAPKATASFYWFHQALEFYDSVRWAVSGCCILIPDICLWTTG